MKHCAQQSSVSIFYEVQVQVQVQEEIPGSLREKQVTQREEPGWII